MSMALDAVYYMRECAGAARIRRCYLFGCSQARGANSSNVEMRVVRHRGKEMAKGN
jgi:hypothetical protein